MRGTVAAARAMCRRAQSKPALADGWATGWATALLCLTVALSSASFAFDDGADGHFEKRTSSHFVLFQDVDIDRSSGFRGSRRFEQQILDVLEAARVACSSKEVDR